MEGRLHDKASQINPLKYLAAPFPPTRIAFNKNNFYNEDLITSSQKKSKADKHFFIFTFNLDREDNELGLDLIKIEDEIN